MTGSVWQLLDTVMLPDSASLYQMSCSHLHTHTHTHKQIYRHQIDQVTGWLSTEKTTTVLWYSSVHTYSTCNSTDQSGVPRLTHPKNPQNPSWDYRTLTDLPCCSCCRTYGVSLARDTLVDMFALHMSPWQQQKFGLFGPQVEMHCEPNIHSRVFFSQQPGCEKTNIGQHTKAKASCSTCETCRLIHAQQEEHADWILPSANPFRKTLQHAVRQTTDFFGMPCGVAVLVL